MDKYKHWFWVLYPVLMIILMFVSAKILFSTDTNKLVEANTKRKQAQTEAEKVANLKSKLDYLNSINQEQYINDLKFLTAAVPASKKPWLTLAEMNLAATRAGMLVSDFYGSIGDIKEASEAATGELPALFIDSKVKVDQIVILREFFNELYKLRPLVKILEFSWSGTSAQMQVDVAYSPWPKIVPEAETAVTENKEARISLTEKLQLFEDIDPLLVYTSTESGALEDGVEISPF